MNLLPAMLAKGSIFATSPVCDWKYIPRWTLVGVCIEHSSSPSSVHWVVCESLPWEFFYDHRWSRDKYISGTWTRDLILKPYPYLGRRDVDFRYVFRKALPSAFGCSYNLSKTRGWKECYKECHLSTWTDNSGSFSKRRSSWAFLPPVDSVEDVDERMTIRDIYITERSLKLSTRYIFQDYPIQNVYISPLPIKYHLRRNASQKAFQEPSSLQSRR